ncbi:hypothetical protein EYV94_21440 [Puteibacter caeruleilacunae]|nr:hypothetical protein EYV94_21440 [Puteibacter caeruleilacunae]
MYCKLMLLCITLAIGGVVRAQNLIDPTAWTVGNSTVPGFENNGLSSENQRIWGDNPFGKRGLLWEAVPNSASDADGGWNTTYFSVDHTKMYRYVVWIKKTTSTTGVTYFGGNALPSNLLYLAGGSTNNPYFWSGDLPELHKWYLLVGYIHGSGDVSRSSYGGIYDGITGKKVVSCTDLKFPVGTTQAMHRTYLYYDSHINDRQYFYAPRVDLVNGNEPSIASLLGLGSTGQISGNLIVDGKVGVNTENLEDYHVSVNGKLRAKEIQVATDWADFVFDDNYQLRSLEELEKYILKNNHLPEMPTSKEVKEKGVSVGDMNKRLLQKIEELTLYVIEQQKANEELKERMQRQEKLISELQSKINQGK